MPALPAHERSRRGGHRREHGQAMLEMAIISPVILAMFAGIFTVSDMIQDLQTSHIAAATAARLGAQLGNNGYSGSGTGGGCQTNGANDPCVSDAAVLGTIMPLMTQMQAETVLEIDIYRPAPCAVQTFSATCPPDDGSYQATDIGERYNGAGQWIGYGNGGGYAGAFTLDKRVQAHPSESNVGVQIKFRYRSPTQLFTADLSAYAEARIPPSFS